jgi:uncharacterized membrane protein
MNAPHIHLMLNHLPVIGLALGLLILLVGLLKKNATVLVVALSITAVAGISSYPTMYSGGASEHYLEEHEQEFQIDHDLLHEHEEAAEIAFWPTVITGIISVLGLFAMYKGFSWTNKVALVVLVLGILSMGLLYQTSNSGGKIRHPELNSCCSSGETSGSCSHENHHEKEGGSCCQDKQSNQCPMMKDSASCRQKESCCKHP